MSRGLGLEPWLDQLLGFSSNNWEGDVFVNNVRFYKWLDLQLSEFNVHSLEDFLNCYNFNKVFAVVTCLKTECDKMSLLLFTRLKILNYKAGPINESSTTKVVRCRCQLTSKIKDSHHYSGRVSQKVAIPGDFLPLNEGKAKYISNNLYNVHFTLISVSLLQAKHPAIRDESAITKSNGWHLKQQSNEKGQWWKQYSLWQKHIQ